MKSVESAMIKPVTVKADDSLNDAVDIMRTRRRHYFVVNNQNKLLGFLDIEDINQGLRARKINDTMQRDVYKVHINSKLQDSVRTILKRNVRNVPVVDNDEHLIGLITRANLVDIVYDSIWGEEDSDSHESPIESSDENNHDLPQNQTDARTNVNEDVNDYHDAQHRGED